MLCILVINKYIYFKMNVKNLQTLTENMCYFFETLSIRTHFLIISTIHILSKHQWPENQLEQNRCFGDLCYSQSTVIILSTGTDRPTFANSVDPDQSLLDAASDQGVHYLPCTQQ